MSPRRHRSGLVASGLVALALSGLVGTAAQAVELDDQDAVSIDHAQPVDGGVELLVSLPPGADPDLDGVQVTIDGKRSRATAAPASDRRLVRRTAVLAIDTSLSMRGERIEAAEAAALAYLDSVPADVRVGVVTFDDDVTTVLEPTRNRAAARAAVTDLQLQRETALYAGVVGAIEAAGPQDDSAGQRSVLLLSDGEDSTGASLADTLRTVADSGALLDVVALQQSGAGAAPLELLAQQGRGQVLDAADPAALTATFEDQARALARQVVITAKVPADLDDTSSDVVVRLPAGAGGEDLTASAYLPVVASEATTTQAPSPAPDTQAAPAQPAPAEAGFQVSDLVALLGVGAVGIGLLGVLLTVGTVRKGPSRDDKLRAHLQAYGVLGAPTQPGVATPEAASSASLGDQARGMAERALAGQAGLEARIAARLEGAAVKMKPAEWLPLHVGIALASGTLGLLLGRGGVVLLLVGLLLGLVGPWVYLGLKQARRLKAFAQALPDTLQLMSGSLSAGLSLAQSVDTIVREGGEPIASEFHRVVVESRLGVPFEDAMDGLAQRMDSKDFTWVVMAIRIQREVGGNLAELLLTVAGTLREREYLRRHVRALSAEGRLSAWVLGGLPPAFLLYLTATKPDYVAPLYTTMIGWLMLGGAGVLMGVGVLWMVKAAKVEL